MSDGKVEYITKMQPVEVVAEVYERYKPWYGDFKNAKFTVDETGAYWEWVDSDGNNVKVGYYEEQS